MSPALELLIAATPPPRRLPVFLRELGWQCRAVCLTPRTIIPVVLVGPFRSRCACFRHSGCRERANLGVGQSRPAGAHASRSAHRRVCCDAVAVIALFDVVRRLVWPLRMGARHQCLKTLPLFVLLPASTALLCFAVTAPFMRHDVRCSLPSNLPPPGLSLCFL